MKKIALFVAAVAVSFSIGGKALADTNTISFADKAGITPDNVLLYPIDKAIDNIRINLTFADDKKAQVLTDVAEERLGESEVMADKGKTDLSIQAMNAYNDKMAEAQSNIENSIDNTTNTTTNSTANSTTDSTAKSDNLNAVETTIENAQTNSIEVLKNIEKKLSGNAKETVAQVIEMQTRKKAAIEAVMKTRQEAAQYITAVKDAKKALEQAQKSGDAQAIQTSENTLKQAQDALNTENQKLSQAIEAKKEAMKGGVGQLKKQARQAGNNQTNSTTNSTGTTTQVDNSTAPATTTTTTTTTTPTSADTTTATNTSSTTTDNTAVTNNTNTDTTVYKNKGQEMKAEKQNEKDEKVNLGQEMKAQKANSASHGSNSRD